MDIFIFIPFFICIFYCIKLTHAFCVATSDFLEAQCPEGEDGAGSVQLQHMWGREGGNI